MSENQGCQTAVTIALLVVTVGWVDVRVLIHFQLLHSSEQQSFP